SLAPRSSLFRRFVMLLNVRVSLPSTTPAPLLISSSCTVCSCCRRGIRLVALELKSRHLGSSRLRMRSAICPICAEYASPTAVSPGESSTEQNSWRTFAVSCLYHSRSSLTSSYHLL